MFSRFERFRLALVKNYARIGLENKWHRHLFGDGASNV